jgi:hypothetical protein
MEETDPCDLVLTGEGFDLGSRVRIPEIGVEIDRVLDRYAS